jgi:type I restriction enzyme M protein
MISSISTLTPEHIDQIFTWYKEYQDQAGVSRVVTLEEIMHNGWNLNIPRYVEPIAKEETGNVIEVITNLKTALAETYVAEEAAARGGIDGRT